MVASVASDAAAQVMEPVRTFVQIAEEASQRMQELACASPSAMPAYIMEAAMQSMQESVRMDGEPQPFHQDELLVLGPRGHSRPRTRSFVALFPALPVPQLSKESSRTFVRCCDAFVHLPCGVPLWYTWKSSVCQSGTRALGP